MVLPLDFKHQSFSRRSAWLKLNYSGEKPHRLHLRTLRQQAAAFKHHPGWAHDYYELALFRGGEELTFQTQAYASHLRLTFNGGEATVLFTDEATLAVYARGAEIHWLALQDAAWHYSPAPGQLLLATKDATTLHHFLSSADSLALHSEASGHLGDTGRRLESILVRPDDRGEASVALRETLHQLPTPPPLPPLAEALAAAEAEVDAWQSRRPEVPGQLEASVRQAWQLMGSFQVNPSAHLTRRTLYCSKNSWLTSIWTWDNCFHALGLAYHSADLAFDQLFAALDQQMPHGALPDKVSDLKSSPGFVKPPVYGWTVRELIRLLGVEACRPFFGELFNALERLTRYWLDFHRHPADPSGLCFYRHGNDSGWDNASVFAEGGLVRPPDLDAYLVLQMECLGELAENLGHAETAEKWRHLAALHLNHYLADMFVNEHPVSRRVPDGTVIEGGETCGLHCIPLILGRRLPAGVISNLLETLRPDGPFLTRSGIASEATDSPHYEPDGYWRGPVWAPVQLLLHTALRDLRETDLAGELLARTTSAWNAFPTFSEHHEAGSGRGLRAPGVMWTAAAHVHFAARMRSGA